MRKFVNLMLGLFLVSLTACPPGQKKPGIPPEQRMAAARKALDTLQAAKFEEAGKEAALVIQKDAGNPQARVVAAIAKYKETMHSLVRDLGSAASGMMQTRHINHEYIRFSLDQADKRLAEVERHLAAAEDASFRMQLCLACWEYDWNHNGRVDDRDMLLLQIEVDANGEPIPEGDPRRKPTFHFDHGDVYWARAMVAFQRTFLNLVMAYKLPEVAEVMGAEERGSVVIKMENKERVHQARDLFLAGLGHADRARKLYLEESDDEGEWLPNPSQKNHPLPLPVDQALYDTWEGVVGDLRKLVSSEEGISVVEAAQLGDHQWKDPPTGYIDVGKLFESPGDITLNIKNLDGLDGERTKEDVERVLRDVLGDKYVSTMKPTRLLSRFKRMKGELERGEDSFERKLRYLFWVN